jgi:hypothetical protein
MGTDVSDSIIVIHPYTVSSNLADIGRNLGWALVATIPL